MNWIDIIILLILVFFVGWGFYKGLIFSVLSLFGNFVNFIISLALTRPVASLLNSWFHLEGALTNGFASHLTKMSAGFNTNIVGMTTSEIRSHVASTLTESKFPMKNLFKTMLRIDGDSIINKTSLSLNDILSKSFAQFFTLIISFVIVFVLIWLVLFLISLISKQAKKVDGIRITDRILGLVFGIIKGSFVICVVFAILAFFNENGVLAPLFDYIKESTLGNFFYSNVNYLVDKYINFKTVVNAVKT